MDTISKIVEILSNFFTVVGIIVGGFWTYFLFIKNRLKYPKVAIKHQVIQKSLDNGKILLHVIIEVDNLGDVLVNLESGEIRLLQVLPIIGKIDKAIQKGEDPVNPDRYDIDWYQLFSRELLISKEQPCEIEPKESESLHLDFIINNDVQTVSIYSFFQIKEKKRKNLGWTCSTIHDIQGDTMKTENYEPEEQTIKPNVRPVPDEPATKQQKIKPASPLITEIKPPKPGGQVPQKPPSEPKPTIKPKP